MRDTEWNDKMNEFVPGTPLDVERFFSNSIFSSRQLPDTWSR